MSDDPEGASTPGSTHLHIGELTENGVRMYRRWRITTEPEQARALEHANGDPRMCLSRQGYREHATRKPRRRFDTVRLGGHCRLPVDRPAVERPRRFGGTGVA